MLIAQADYRESGGGLLINRLLESHTDVTLVFSANDQMAYGAQLALEWRNIRVTDDISLVGFDGFCSMRAVGCLR